MSEQVHLNDVGNVFTLTIVDSLGAVVNLSTGTVDIVFGKPSGEILTKDGVFVTNGSDGLVKYTSVADDLDESGIWTIQAVTTIGATTFHSSVNSFLVWVNVD